MERSQDKTAHIVIAILEAVKGKEDILKKALIDVIEPSRNEESCIDYQLHQDKNNEAQFILYEKWKSSELHSQQFTKPYILSLIEQLPTLLAKPYQVIFAKDLS